MLEMEMLADKKQTITLLSEDTHVCFFKHHLKIIKMKTIKRAIGEYFQRTVSSIISNAFLIWKLAIELV